MDQREDFATAINQRLAELDRSPAWLAERLDVSPSSVSRWLKAETRPRDPETVIRIADVLGIHNPAERNRLLRLVGYGYVEREEETAPKQNSPGSTIEDDEHTRWMLRWLPIPTYQQLFGVSSYSEELLRYLRSPDQHHIICIQGIGGIGKTALADAVVRSYIQDSPAIHDVLWIRARQESLYETDDSQAHISIEVLFDDLGDQLGIHEVLRLPLTQKVNRLGAELRSKPYLVIIDNLETVQELRQLTQWLERLANPSKFLLTSRKDVPALTTVSRVLLGELSAEDSHLLIMHTAERKQVSGFNAEDVFNLVGGNPLAIILTVSQMKYIPPEEVLTGIRLGSIEDIYNYVYWKVWSVLDNDAKQILLAIQRSADRANWLWLSSMSGVAAANLPNALKQLIELSLVVPPLVATTSGYYSIHRLTSTFLQAEVLGWK